MRYATEAAFRAALEARLLNLAGPNNNKQLVRFRKMVAYERLLARLAVVAPDQWIVKGGLALEFRYGDRSRTTVDLDLGVPMSTSTLTELLVDAGRLNLADYFQYIVDRTQSLAFQDDVDVARYRITVLLDGRRFEQIAIDVGSGHLPDACDSIQTSNLLEFAGFEPMLVPTIPLAVHVAEKLHAYTRQYGEGRQSTRVKDLIDIVLIASLSSFELGPLRAAIHATFASREVQSIPLRLPPPGEHWRRPYALLAREVGLAEDLDDGYRASAVFLDPVLDASPQTGKRWDPVRLAWLPK